MRYIGMDPGSGGGIAVLDEDGTLLHVTKMPETGRDLLDWLKAVSFTPVGPERQRAMVERVHAAPKMGVVSAFTFGRNYERLLMALLALGIPFDEVTPQAWQKALGCSSGRKGFKGGDKGIPKRRAQELFPDVKVTNAIADALLIAEHARRVDTRGEKR